MIVSVVIYNTDYYRDLQTTVVKQLKKELWIVEADNCSSESE